MQQHWNCTKPVLFWFRKFYCDEVHGPEHAGCEHFVKRYAPAAFRVLGDYMANNGGELCQDVFDCPETTEGPTEGPTEEPTTLEFFEA